ncbi:MAG: hypothetical protein ABIG39_03730 [Candidatus Micrarchaeota archaeon]
MEKPMSDDEIATRCGLKVSDVRAVLNKLHEYGITTYARERDKDTGWFSYNWTVNLIKLYEVMEKRQENANKRDEEKLSYERSYMFYTCVNNVCLGKSQRIPEPDAVLTSYICDRCGEQLRTFDNTEVIKSIEKRLVSRLSSENTFIKQIRVPTRPKPLQKRPFSKLTTTKSRPKKPMTSAKKTKAKSTRNVKPSTTRRKKPNARGAKGKPGRSKAKKKRRS